MVLFIYICRLASNEIFSLKIRYYEMAIVLFIIFVLTFLTKRIASRTNINYSIFIMNILTKINIFTVVLTIFYLLFTLIVVVKISNKKLGPIRSKKN